MVGVVIGIMLLGTAVLGYWLIFGRTGSLKKKWEAGVIARAEEIGAVAVKKTGTFSFSMLRFDDPGPTPVTAIVYTGVMLERTIANYYRYFNTNDWLTVIEAEFPHKSGVGFSCAKGEGSPAYRQKVDTGDAAFDEAFPVWSDDPAGAALAWSPRARELMVASGAPFTLISGGVKVTAVTQGVVADAETIRAVAALAGELARRGARPPA